MANAPIEQVSTPSRSAGGVPLFDSMARLGERLETETLSVLAAVPTLISDIAATLPPAERIGADCGQAFAVMGGILLAYWLVRRALRPSRLASAQTRNAFLGLARFVGFELLALAIATAVGRVVLVRALGYTPGAASFPVDVGTAIVRWLSGLTVALVIFQPEAPRFRLVPLDDRGARIATVGASAVLALGHAQNVLIETALRNGLPSASAKFLSVIAAFCLAAASVALLYNLRRHGLRPLIVAITACLVVGVTFLWIAAWFWRDFSVYRGGVAIITIMLIALALDRTLVLAIKESRHPQSMRRLFMLRVALDGLAALIVTRIILDFWAASFSGLFSAGEWRGMTIRITAACFIVYVGGLACAGVHLWVDSILHPASKATGDRSRDNQLTRLSTVLPLIRFAAIALIATIFILAALSTVGIDVTPLLAGAGVIGLAVSLGSQTLVKDIVAGLFYMMDDVFRLGETIEAGAHSGVIEQIKLRSIRLRGEDGRLHTIPLGELGAVTNLSRRLSTVTIRIATTHSPDRRALEWFKIRVWSAFQSEPAIRSAVVGEMATLTPSGGSSDDETLAYSISMADGAARQQRDAMRFLVEEIIDDLEPSGVKRPVSIAIDEPAAAQPAPMP